jgi:hypothetical protein
MEGVTVIATVGAGLDTVIPSEPEIPDRVAEIFAWPAVTLVTNPLAETVATAEFEEDQLAEGVTFVVEPSLYVPVAVSWWVCPTMSVTVAGVTEMLVRVFALTVIVSDLETPESVAVMLPWPVATLVTSPLADTVATEEFEEDQAAVELTSFVEPSL